MSDHGTPNSAPLRTGELKVTSQAATSTGIYAATNRWFTATNQSDSTVRGTMGTTLRLDTAGLGTLVTPARALCPRRSGLGLRSRYRLNMLRPSATGPDGNGGKEESSPGPGMSEDVMARLKKAELEAAELRKQLEAVQVAAVSVGHHHTAHCVVGHWNAQHILPSLPPTSS